MNPHYRADSQRTPLFPPRTELQPSTYFWTTTYTALCIIALGIIGGLIIGVVYAFFLGFFQGLITGVTHGVIAGGSWALLWYYKWSDKHYT